MHRNNVNDIDNSCKMKLAFDASVLIWNMDKDVNRSGLFFAAFNIAERLLNREDIDLYFYISKSKCKRFKECLKITFPSARCGVITENSKVWFYIDVYYSPLYKAPSFIENMRHIKKYITLHDTLFNIFPELFDDEEYILWYKLLLKSINDDYYYFPNSENTKRDFIKYAPKINPNRMRAVYLGVNEDFRPLPVNERVLKKYGIPKDKKYMFNLCMISPRKNLIRIIRTFFKFIEKNNIEDMVFALGGASLKQFINRFEKEISEYKDRIIKIGYVDDEDLPYLYSGAHWFVYTSQYEGFGLPPLEAMACGCPVITSNNSSLPEVVGDAAITIDFDSDERHISAYEKYYYNEEYRKEMSKKGLERSKLFSWDKCVNTMLEVMFNDFDCNLKNGIRFIKTEDLIYFKVFGFIFALPRLKTLLSAGRSEDGRFIVIIILGVKIAVKNNAKGY